MQSVPKGNEQKALKAVNNERRPYKFTQNITCFFCKKPNHVKKECRKYIEWKKNHPDHKANTVNETKNDDGN